MKTHSKFHGFTLPELLITIGVVSIILSAAVPSISKIVQDNRLAAQLNTVMADVHMARNEAVKRGVRIILCRTADPDLPTPTCGGTERDYSTGYLIFTGEDGNNTYQAGTDTLIRRAPPAQEGVTLLTSWTWNNNLEINPSGTLNEGGTAIMAMCDDRGKEHGRQVTIPLTGMPRMYSGNIASCNP